MKLLKKFSYVMLIIVLLGVQLIIPSNETVSAKTLRDLKEELADLENQYANQQEEKKLTEEQIAAKRASINQIQQEISDTQDSIASLTIEIEELGKEIIAKNEDIKEIMQYYQLSSTGESAYMEYIFKSVDFADFIYRVAIAEQLSDYNDTLIKEYSALIVENEQKKTDLINKTASLREQQNTLQNELISLGSQLSEILDEGVSIEQDIESMKELVDTYENKYGCNLDEDLSVCGVDKLPPGTAFFRPVDSGKVSANYGWYYPWGEKTWHYGMDFSKTGHGANVYSIANGVVAYITRPENYNIPDSTCGGNMVYIWHTINGVDYTSAYFHLATINVEVGDVVTYNTVIGTVGGDRSIETWDRCSTGSHLHLQIAHGLTARGLAFYTRQTATTFDPRNVLNVPAEGGWFTNRIVKY